MFGEVSGDTRDHFDHVARYTDQLYQFDRWPDEQSMRDDDSFWESLPTKRISTKRIFIATQPTITPSQARRYALDLMAGDKLPPIVGVKTPDGIAVWNGHHRLTAHRLAGKKTIPVRFVGEVTDSVL